MGIGVAAATASNSESKQQHARAWTWLVDRRPKSQVDRDQKKPAVDRRFTSRRALGQGLWFGPSKLAKRAPLDPAVYVPCWRPLLIKDEGERPPPPPPPSSIWYLVLSLSPLPVDR